jgi:glycosyltransferase involved in cell wall biosynthesis
MRLTLVTETFPPEVNGVARTLGRWVETFQRRGHTIQVLRPRQPGESYRPDRFRSFRLPFYQEVRIGLATSTQVSELLWGFRTDLVHVATEGILGVAATRAALRLGLPLVTSYHTNYDHYLGHYGFGLLAWACRAYLGWFHNRARLTLVPSESTRKQLLAQGYRSVEIWSRGVDADHFHPRHRDPAVRASLGLGPNDPLLIYVGRLAPEKNIATLLDAFSRLRQLVDPKLRDRIRLALVGGGPLVDSLRAACPPGVVLAGYQHGTALARWYASGDIFVFPSLTETFGNVVLEAQASGLVVVGFNCQPIDERVTDGQDGFLVRIGSDLAQPLLQLCYEVDLRRQMAAAARNTAEAQDWRPIFDGLEQLYSKLVQPRRA